MNSRYIWRKSANGRIQDVGSAARSPTGNFRIMAWPPETTLWCCVEPGNYSALKDERDFGKAKLIESIHKFNPTYGSGRGSAEISTPARGIRSLDMSRVAITVANATSRFPAATHSRILPNHCSRLVCLSVRGSNKSGAASESEAFSSCGIGW